MVKLNSNYLKTEEVAVGDTIKFVDEGSWEDTKYTHPDGNPKKQFVMKVEFKGENKNMRINKTNRDALCKAWGDDTIRWVGKSARITLENVMVSGALKKSIFLTPVLNGDKTNPSENKKEAWDE